MHGRRAVLVNQPEKPVRPARHNHFRSVVYLRRCPVRVILPFLDTGRASSTSKKAPTLSMRALSLRISIAFSVPLPWKQITILFGGLLESEGRVEDGCLRRFSWTQCARARMTLRGRSGTYGIILAFSGCRCTSATSRLWDSVSAGLRALSTIKIKSQIDVPCVSIVTLDDQF